MKEPRRLRDDFDVPKELRQALRELASNAPSAETVTRVERMLERFTGPPVPPGGFSAQSSGSAGAYVAGVVSLIAVAAWMRHTNGEPLTTSPIRVLGAVVEGREVFAVDMLRRLGHSTAANAGVERFAVHFTQPNCQKRRRAAIGSAGS